MKSVSGRKTCITDVMVERKPLKGLGKNSYPDRIQNMINDEKMLGQSIVTVTHSAATSPSMSQFVFYFSCPTNPTGVYKCEIIILSRTKYMIM